MTNLKNRLKDSFWSSDVHLVSIITKCLEENGRMLTQLYFTTIMCYQAHQSFFLMTMGYIYVFKTANVIWCAHRCNNFPALL